MLQLLTACAKKAITFTLAIFAPSVALRKTDGRMGRCVVTTIHIVAMLGIAVGLLTVQLVFSLDQYMRTSSWVLRNGWLPIVATMLYTLAWSCWYLARVVRLPNEANAQRDLINAWNQATDRIARAGIDLQKTPLFLTLGRPTGGIHHFFAAAGFGMSVPPTPADDDAPIRICGNQDALFLCCDRSSLLDDFVTRLARRDAQRDQMTNANVFAKGVGANQPAAHHWESSGNVASPRMRDSSEGNHPESNFTSGGTATAVASKTSTIPRTSDTSTATRVELHLDALQQHLVEAETVLQPTVQIDTLTDLDTDVAEQIDQRLQQLCRLLVEHRDPYCPINGVVLLVPIAATDNEEIADHVGMRIEHDLETIVEAVQTGVSVQMVLTGLERCDGAKALLSRFPKAQRDRRLGAVIPVAPASEPEAQSMLIDKTSEWLCNDLFPPLVARLLVRDGSDAEADLELQRGNLKLHRLVQMMRGRQSFLSRMMRRAIATTGSDLRMRGCFITATGDDAVHGQGFTAGVIPMILGCQNEVRWLASRRRRDYWQWVSVVGGYLTIATAAVGLIAVFCCG
jgi:hypothetical protein